MFSLDTPKWPIVMNINTVLQIFYLSSFYETNSCNYILHIDLSTWANSVKYIHVFRTNQISQMCNPKMYQGCGSHCLIKWIVNLKRLESCWWVWRMWADLIINTACHGLDKEQEVYCCTGINVHHCSLIYWYKCPPVLSCTSINVHHCSLLYWHKWPPLFSLVLV